MEKNRLDGLLALKLVTKYRNFTAASEELGVTPSAISQMITQLEKRMRVTLLSRTTRSVTLTEAGEHFLSQAGPAIDQILMAQEAINSFVEKPSGTLRINMPKDVYSLYLISTISSFMVKYPEVTVDLVFDDEASEIFRLGFDAGIRPSDIVAKDLTAIKISDPIQWVAVASPKYLKKSGVPSRPQELLSHNCIRKRQGNGTSIYDHWEFVEKGKDFSVHITGSLILNDSAEMVRAAVADVGITYIMEDAVRDHLKSGKLVVILEKYLPSSEGFYLYYPNRDQTMPKLRAFIEHIKMSRGVKAFS